MRELEAEGITDGAGPGGCGKPNYEPREPVTRGEMAKFLRIAFAL